MKQPGNNSQLQITDADRQWVDESFELLTECFGYPLIDQYAFSETCFPITFSGKGNHVEGLLTDICMHLGMDRRLFSYKTEADLSQSSGIPYTLVGTPDCQLLPQEEGKYHILVSQAALQYPGWLCSMVSRECVRAFLAHNGLTEALKEDSLQFVYFAQVYFGYGGILAENLMERGRSWEGIWERNWFHFHPTPMPVVAYALAVFARLKNDTGAKWSATLPGEVAREMERGVCFLDQSENPFFNSAAIREARHIDHLLRQAEKRYREGNYASAILCFEELIRSTDDPYMLATAHNNIGYYKLRLGQYPESIPSFQRALELDPGFAYAQDNLGLALIMTGKPEEGKDCLERALQTEGNDPAYSFRNMAIYFWKKGDARSAEKYFQKAFEFQTPVDALGFFYGLFLMDQGDTERGEKHIQLSLEAGEPEALAYAKNN